LYISASGLSLALLAKLSNEADRRSSRSDRRPVLDFVFLAAEFFNFEFELYRAASVAVLERFFLFYVSLDEQVLYVGYPVPFLLNAICVSVHCQSPSKHF
jgi:hypothetical protein